MPQASVISRVTVRFFSVDESFIRFADDKTRRINQNIYLITKISSNLN